MRSTVRVKKALPYTYAQPEATPPASIPGSKFNRVRRETGKE